jgi:transcriptional regulator with XRE-family HTH domain
LRRHQRQQGLNSAQFARLLQVSAAALTRYYAGDRLPSSEVFAFSVLLMGRELRDYVTSLPDPAA